MATLHGWTSHAFDTGPVPVSIFTHADADRLVAVPARPLLANDALGRPKVSLTLVLSQRPAVEALSIEPLITQGLLAFTVTLALPEEALRPLEQQLRETVKPLFARSAAFTLVHADKELQRIEASGPGATAAFSVTLPRDAALQTLTAMRDTATQLTLECHVTYSIDEVPSQLRLRGGYQDIYEHLIREGRRPLTHALVEAAVAAMVLDGTLHVDSSPTAASTEMITDAFLKASSPVLHRVTAYDGQRYSPRPPPNTQQLDLTVRIGGGGRTSTLTLVTGLHELLRGRLDGLDSDVYMHLVAPDRTGVLAPVPRRAVQTLSRDRATTRALGAAQLARIGKSAAALTAVARPNPTNGVNAHVLLADTTVQPTLVSKIDPKIHYWAVDNLVLHETVGNQPAQRSLPIVDDASAPLWADRVNAKMRWYAPVLMAVPLEPNSDLQTSAFLFAFHAEGHLACGVAGLEGTIRFRLQRSMSDATRAAWESAGKPTAKPVATAGLSVALSVPFRDQSGNTRTQAFPATLRMEGDNVLAEVALLDDWVRLAYGALSTSGFQSEPAALTVAYTFDAYVPVHPGNLSLLFDRKEALTPIVQPHTPIPEQRSGAYLDARQLIYRTPVSALRFTPEQTATAIARPQFMPFAIRPGLAQSTALTELLQERRYGLQSLARHATQTVLYPCLTFGEFYVQDDEQEGRVAIGCRDAFKLGQTEYRQYQRVDTLSDREYSVWRSLQQPGRFLLVPTRWSIARFAADDPDRAYRPAILVYSTIDAEIPGNNRCAVLASLVPDIAPSTRRALLRSLEPLAQTPVLTLVNEIEAEIEFAWTLPSASGIEVRVAKLFDSFQVTIGTGIDTMAQLQAMLRTAGIVGTARYRLPDGSSVEAALSLDLNRIVGPLPDGPVEADVRDAHCTLTNHIERAVDVSDLMVDTANGRIETIRVDQRLAPGATWGVEVPTDATSAVPLAAMAPGDAATLTEIRSFVEDVHTNVAFVNLVNYANHDLKSLSLQARLHGVAGTQTLPLSDKEPVGSLDFVLPLTVYLAEPVLEFAVTRTQTDGTTLTTDWLNWPFNARGNVVSLTWELIAQ